MSIDFDYNAYNNNTSGARHNISAGAEDVTLTGVPFVTKPGNWALNGNGGQGLACQGAGFPASWAAMGQSSTTSHPDIGAIQGLAGSGGSSSPFASIG